MPSFTFRRSNFLARQAARFREAPRQIHAIVERRVGAAVEELLRHQFDTATDPHDRPYKPPIDGHLPPMTRSRALRDGMRVVVVSGPGYVRVGVMSDRDYARFLQEGTRKMSPRLIVPGAVLSGRWRAQILGACNDSVREWFGSAK